MLWIAKAVKTINVLINVHHAMIVMVMEYVLISVRLIKYVVEEHVIMLKMLQAIRYHQLLSVQHQKTLYVLSDAAQKKIGYVVMQIRVQYKYIVRRPLANA